jgi:hypothetical protein
VVVRVYLAYAWRRRLIVTFGSCYGTARVGEDWRAVRARRARTTGG